MSEEGGTLNKLIGADDKALREWLELLNTLYIVRHAIADINFSEDEIANKRRIANIVQLIDHVTRKVQR